MYLTFKELEILNFMSFIEESFDFSTNHGINLICGINNDIPGNRNGAGKSNILNSLVFCLFDQTINDIKKEHIRNRFASEKDKCEVALNLIADGIRYRIIRGITPKSNAKYCNLFKYNSETNDYDDITKSGKKETQKFIEKEILKCDISLFLRSILLTSDQSYNFFKLKEKEKYEFIEQIFDLTIFGIMFDLLHKDILKLDKEIYALSREYKTLEDQHTDINIRKEKYDIDLLEKRNNIELLLEQYKKQLEEFSNDNNDYSNLLTTYLTDKENNLSKITKLTEKQKEIQLQYHTADKEIEKLKLKITQNNTAVNKHTKSLTLLCNDCLTKFDNFYKISDLTNENLVFTKEQEDNQAIKNKAIDNNNKLTAAIKQIQTKNSEIIKNYNDIVNKNNIKNKNIEKINNNISNNIFLLKKVDEEKNPHIDTLNSLQEKIDKIDEDLSKLNENSNHLKYVEKLISPDMIRKLIIKDLVTQLNQRIQLYIGRMGAKFNCVFDENLYYRFYTDSGETSYDNFSSGEKMRLSIATSFAFRDFMSLRSNINSNILILDEYLDSNLDSASITNLMSILKEFSILNKYDVYIVSHRIEIADTFFNKIITVEKTNGISKINISK